MARYTCIICGMDKKTDHNHIRPGGTTCATCYRIRVRETKALRGGAQ